MREYFHKSYSFIKLYQFIKQGNKFTTPSISKLLKNTNYYGLHTCIEETIIYVGCEFRKNMSVSSANFLKKEGKVICIFIDLPKAFDSGQTS